MSLNIVEIPYSYFPDFNRGRPLYNASIYVGIVDTDPEQPINQKPVTLRQEDGTEIPAAQPILTSSGGVPIYNGGAVTILVDGSYSVKVLDNQGNQEYYSPDVTKGIPVTEEALPELLPIYTDIVYKASGGNSSVENMVNDFNLDPLAYAVGTILKTGGTSWRYEDSTGPITIENFRALNAYSIRDFGALGGGVDDTDAFFAASAAITQAGGGTLFFPLDEYTVGRQTVNPTPSPTEQYYQSAGYPLEFTGCDGLILEFNGSTIKTPDGQYFGAFDPLTGGTVPSGGVDVAFRASILTIIEMVECKNITISNGTLDGNTQSVILGGFWGDSGYQLDHTGIRFRDCSNFVVSSMESINFGMDGLTVIARQLGDNRHDHQGTIQSCTFDGNGRQGCSWIGGENLVFESVKFTRTARGTIPNTPGAGLDIEDNGNGCNSGTFTNCLFADNGGAELLAFSNPRNMNFKGCTVAGDGRGIWWDSVTDDATCVFDGCFIYANIVFPGKRTTFTNCQFSDGQYLNYPIPNQLIIEDNDATEFTTIENSTFITTRTNTAFSFVDRTMTMRNITWRLQTDSTPLRHRFGLMRPDSVDNMQIIDEMTNSDGLSAPGEHAFIEGMTGSLPNLNQWHRVQFNTDKVSTARTNGEYLSVGQRRSSAISDRDTFSASSSTELRIPLKSGSYIAQLVNVTGVTSALARNRVTLLHNSTSTSSNAALHSCEILGKVENGLGTGGISVVLADPLEGNLDTLLITSDDQDLTTTDWYIHYVALDFLGTAIADSVRYD